MKTVHITLLGIFLSSSIAFGQTRIKEIFQGTNSSEPKSFQSTPNNNFFFNNLNLLYKTDGTEAGTILLTDPNDNSFIFPQIQNSKAASTVGDKLIFRAYQTNDYKGQELWVSDGTVNGTFELKDINPGSSDSNPSSFIPLNNGKTIFYASVNNQNELWVTDGTEMGTHRLKDFIPSVNVIPEIVYHSDTTFFITVRNLSTNENSLWVSNGSTNSTVKLGDINAINEFTYLNGFWYFSGSIIGVADFELWKTNGTAAGTSRVKDIIVGTSGFYPSGLKTVNNKVVFTKGVGNDKELWESDGTEIGTVLLKDINPGSPSSSPHLFFNFNSEVYFVAADGTHGLELWKTNGTETGTMMVKDINPNSTGTLNLSFNLTTGRNFQGGVNNILFFLANDGTHGEELWRTDGTPGGTFLVSDINPGAEGSHIDNVFLYNNEILFTAQKGDGTFELFTANGSPTGTQTFFDKYGVSNLSNPYILGKGSNGELYFTAFSPAYGYELFKLVGTAVSLVKDIDTNTESDILDYDREKFVANTDSLAYFVMNDNEHGFEIWMTDGSTSNTKRISNFDPYPVENPLFSDIKYLGNSIPALSNYVTFKDYVYFNFGSSIYRIFEDNIEEWKILSAPVNQLSADENLLKWLARDSLFTFGGTVTKSYFIASGGFANPSNVPIHVINNTAYLFYPSSLYGNELFGVNLLDSTAALVKDIRPGSQGYFTRDFVKTNGHLFTILNNSFWISDGTTAGTFTVDINPSGFDQVYKIIQLNEEKVIFTADDGVNGQEAWVSDGTLAGTKMVQDLGPGNSLFNVSALNLNLFTQSNEQVYFFARGNLCVTNGDTITTLVNSINGENPYALNGRVYTKVYTGPSTGWEPISADKEGFELLSDLYLGSESSLAQSFINAGQKLFFLARDNSGRYAPYVFNTCPADLLLKVEITSSSNLLSEFSITGTENNQIQAGNTVNYQTNDFILLKPGFVAESGAVFKAEIGSGCVE